MGIYIKPGFVNDRKQDATNMKVGEFGFHGDVVIKKVEKLPDAKLKSDSAESKIKALALGEVTGHVHQLQTEDGAMDTEVMVLEQEDSNTKYMVVPEGHTTTLRHQEHSPIKFGEGIYEIVIQNEYDYLTDAIRRVAD